MSSTKSHNQLDLHFYPIWKEHILSRASEHSFPEEIIKNTPIDQLFKMISGHELELLEQTETLQKLGKLMIAKESLSYLTISPLSAALKGGTL